MIIATKETLKVQSELSFLPKLSKLGKKDFFSCFFGSYRAIQKLPDSS